MAANPVPIPDLKIEAVTTPEDLVRCTGKITSTSSGTLQHWAVPHPRNEAGHLGFDGCQLHR
jgi:hypothetical protein